MSTIEKVCSQVLRMVTPRPSERKRILDLAESIMLKVSKELAASGVEASARLDGSVAKDTWLSGEADLDIFIQFPSTLTREELEKYGLNVGRRAVRGHKVVERFAEHPYIEAYIDETRVNIVPCYMVEKGKWRSATDRTPYHTEYMKKRLANGLKGQVRILKKFLKASGIYGAEIKTSGFSGFLCETLTLHYGSFQNLIKASTGWRRGHIVDLERYYSGREDELRDLFTEPLIVVDPIDEGRNIAASVAEDKMWSFVAQSREFLKKPAPTFFSPKPGRRLTERQILGRMRKNELYMLFLIFGKVDAVVDVLWSQLYKTEGSLRNLLSGNGFNVLRSAAWSDESDLNVIVFELENIHLSAVRKHYGPPVAMAKDSESFLQKHLAASNTVSGPRIEDGRWVVERLRNYRDAKSLLTDFLRGGGRDIGVASLVAESIKRKFRILVGEGIAETYSRNKGFAEFLSNFMVGKPSWLDF